MRWLNLSKISCFSSKFEVFWPDVIFDQCPARGSNPVGWGSLVRLALCGLGLMGAATADKGLAGTGKGPSLKSAGAWGIFTAVMH